MTVTSFTFRYLHQSCHAYHCLLSTYWTISKSYTYQGKFCALPSGLFWSIMHKILLINRLILYYCLFTILIYRHACYSSWLRPVITVEMGGFKIHLIAFCRNSNMHIIWRPSSYCMYYLLDGHITGLSCAEMTCIIVFNSHLSSQSCFLRQ